MSTYELPNGENNYGMLDFTTGYDLKAERVMPGVQTFVRTENNVPNNGCLVKNLYDLDTISQIYLVMEPSVASPRSGWAAHTEHEEVGVVLDGSGVLAFPDGVTHRLKPGDCWYIDAGQPHRFENDTLTTLKMMVAHTCPIAQVERDVLPVETSYQKKNGYSIKNVDDCIQSLAPGFTGDRPDAGHYTSIIFEGKNICVLHPLMCPNNSSPMYDYVSHPNVHELEFALSGEATVAMPDKLYHLTPNIARYNPPLQPSKSWNNYGEDLRLIVFYSTGKLANVKRIHNHAVTFVCKNL